MNTECVKTSCLISPPIAPMKISSQTVRSPLPWQGSMPRASRQYFLKQVHVMPKMCTSCLRKSVRSATFVGCNIYPRPCISLIRWQHPKMGDTRSNETLGIPCYCLLLAGRMLPQEVLRSPTKSGLDLHTGWVVSARCALSTGLFLGDAHTLYHLRPTRKKEKKGGFPCQLL